MASNSSDQDISFKPLSTGLGFHPFSDGLPYAPVTKNLSQKPPALGAEAAGLPTFARTLPPRPVSAAAHPGGMPPMAARISVPIAEPTAAQRSIPPRPAPAAASTPSSGLGREAEPRLGFVYLLKRVFAYSIDTAVNLGLCGGALSFALWKQGLTPDALLSPGVVAFSVLFLLVFNWAMITAQEIAFGTTLGKRLFRLTLLGSTSAIFLRSFFFLPSVGFCGVGLLWALFDRRRRCWHDLVVDLQPSEIARL